MREGTIFRYIGLVLLTDALFMAVSAGVSVANNFDASFFPLVLSTIMTAVLGLFPVIFVKKSTQRLSPKELYSIVTGAWLLSCVVGMFPYLMSGGEFSIWNAWFESVSGFTTTGSTIITDVEMLPKGLLFWRAATHWIGGLGVMLFMLILVSGANKTRITMSSFKLTPFAKENFQYHTNTIIRIMLLVYVGLTIAETIALMFAGMGWFDAVCHSFSTIATRGFSTRNASIAAFDSLAVESIVSVFAILSGIHFGLIFATIIGRRNNMFRSEVVRYYLGCILVGAVIIAADLVATHRAPDFLEGLRVSFFQSVSVITSTGFAIDDPNYWSPLAMTILLFFTIQGACAGSTSGGLRSDRVLLAFKNIGYQIRKQQHPNAVLRLKLNGIAQNEKVVNLAMFYIVIYIVIIIGGTLINTAVGVDFVSGFTASVASMSNVGPGFGSVGMMDTYAGLPIISKIASTIMMLLGRLEIFGLLQLFLLKWWV